MPIHRIQRIWQNAGNESVVQQESIQADSETNLDIAVADEATALQANVAIDVSALKSLYIASDQDVTIETNSSGSPDDTIEITANVPLIWTPDCGFDCPLTADVTAFFLANASGEDATLQVRLLQDSTP